MPKLRVVLFLAVLASGVNLTKQEGGFVTQNPGRPCCFALPFLSVQSRNRCRSRYRLRDCGARGTAMDTQNEENDFIRSSASLMASRRFALGTGCASILGLSAMKPDQTLAFDNVDPKRAYFQRFPTLFAPLYGSSKRETTRREVGDGVWVLEQTLELGPLQTPIRSVVIRLKDGTLWVHAPLAPTQEFFELVEACGGGPSSVAHVVVPTYALEHKVFAKDALLRWQNARLWTSPGQFSFPLGASDEFVWGRAVSGVLFDSDKASSSSVIPWTDEIQFETLTAGTFNVGLSRQTFYETAFFHVATKSLVVTDAVAQIPLSPPALLDPSSLLLLSKRSTSDAMPDDTPAGRQDGWEKLALLVSYFFPEHEELDPQAVGVVTWTDGWHDNFRALAGRLLVPPVVRTLIYAQNPPAVKAWVQRVVRRWDFKQILPAHWAAPVAASPAEFERAFAFLDDETADAFPRNDLARGLRLLADAFVRRAPSQGK